MSGDQRKPAFSKDRDHAYTSAGDHDDLDDDGNQRAECGVGSFKPRALRLLANMPMFTGVYSFSALLTSTLSSYVNSQVTTLERHFGFNSAQTGLIMAANDVGFLAVVLFVSYVAAKVHIPRALGSVTVLFGISGIMCALPYFMFGAPSPQVGSGRSANSSVGASTKSSRAVSGQVCDGINETLTQCGAEVITTGVAMTPEDLDPGSRARANAGAALVVIVIGMVLQGIAKTPRTSFVTVYVDANVEKTKTGFFMGCIFTLGIMGPAMAFALGGIFTRIYVTLEGIIFTFGLMSLGLAFAFGSIFSRIHVSLKDTDMHFRHPQWIGAWWLGYITFGCAACVFAIPLFFFPRRVKGGKARKARAATVDRVSAPRAVSDFIKGWAATLFRLVTNPVYACAVLSSCSLMFSIAGGQSFTAKYIENQFSFPVWKANLAMAGMMLGTACLGTFLGGYISKRFKMGPLVSIKFVCLTQALSVVFTGLQMVFKCDQPSLYNSPGPLATAETSLSGCLDNCACEPDEYFPVCGDDGRSFFSPCHAGCLQTVGRTYTNCTCVAGGTAVPGMCDYGCAMFYPFMICIGLSALFGTFAIIPKLIIYIRATEERDKPLALGVASFMSSIFGWMLGPICFGKLIDGICIQWESGCTGSGSCRLYDNDNFRLKLYGYQTAFKALGLVLIICAFIVAKVTKKFGDDDESPKDVELKFPLTNGDSAGEKGKGEGVV